MDNHEEASLHVITNTLSTNELLFEEGTGELDHDRKFLTGTTRNFPLDEGGLQLATGIQKYSGDVDEFMSTTGTQVYSPDVDGLESTPTFQIHSTDVDGLRSTPTIQIHSTNVDGLESTPTIQNHSPDANRLRSTPTIQIHSPDERENPNRPSNNDPYNTIKSKIIRPRTHRFGRIKQWESAFHEFAQKNQKLGNKHGTVFYLKRGTTGISGQLIGICDSFYVAATTGKLLQFASSVVTDTFFSFGLPHLYVPMNESAIEQSYRSIPPSFNSSWDVVLTAVTNPDPLSKPIKPLKKYHNILFSTLHVTADRFFREKGNRDVMERLGVIRYKNSPAPEGRSELYNMVDVYYGRCVKSLFHPSAALESVLKQYEEKLGNGLRIGVHIRMGNGMSDWKDSHTFLDHSAVAKFVRRLKDMILDIEKKYPELPIKIFLSTDSSTEEATMKKNFAKYIVTTEGIRSHVGGIYFTSFDDLSIQKAVLDQMLLGKCDYLFLTKRSGFSRIGLYYAPEGTPYKYI